MEKEVYRALQDLLQITSSQASRDVELQTQLKSLQSCLVQLFGLLIGEQLEKESRPEGLLEAYRTLLAQAKRLALESNSGQP